MVTSRNRRRTRHRLRQTAALCLGVLLLLISSGCSRVQQIVDNLTGEHTAAPTATPSDTLAFEAVDYEVPPQTVPFPQMVYTQPDAGAMAQQIRDLAGQITTETTEEQALGLMGSAQDLYNNYSTAETLAMIHNSMDYADPYWQEQYSYCAANKPVIQEAMSVFNQTLARSPVGQAAGMTPSSELYQYAAVMPLLQQQTQLVNLYSQQLATNTATFSGETYTLGQCVSNEMTENWIAQNADALGSVYLDLIRVRNQLAAACGYNNYVEFIFAVDGKDYTPAQVSSLLDRIAGSLAPIYAEIQQKGIYAINVRLSQEELFEDLRRIFLRLDPQLEATLQFMRNYELYDLSLGPNKSSQDFATYIVNYAAPFLMVSFDGSWEAMNSTVNEFGHFFNFAVDPNAGFEDMDTQEIFSLALQLLTANRYGECFSEDDAYMMRYNALADAYNLFPYQGYLTGFEMEVYTLPDAELTFDNLCNVSERQWNRFGLGTQSTVSRTDWVTTPHIFTSPFYPVSYLTSADVAMQIWERSLTDPKQAMSTYMQLIDGSASETPFLTNVHNAGLASPFDDGEIARQATWFRNFLIYETAEDGAVPATVPPTSMPAPGEPTAEPTPLPDYLDPGQQMNPESSPYARATRNRFHALDRRWGVPTPRASFTFIPAD